MRGCSRVCDHRFLPGLHPAGRGDFLRLHPPRPDDDLGRVLPGRAQPDGMGHRRLPDAHQPLDRASHRPQRRRLQPHDRRHRVGDDRRPCHGGHRPLLPAALPAHGAFDDTGVPFRPLRQGDGRDRRLGVPVLLRARDSARGAALRRERHRQPVRTSGGVRAEPDAGHVAAGLGSGRARLPVRHPRRAQGGGDLGHDQRRRIPDRRPAGAAACAGPDRRRQPVDRPRYRLRRGASEVRHHRRRAGLVPSVRRPVHRHGREPDLLLVRRPADHPARTGGQEPQGRAEGHADRGLLQAARTAGDRAAGRDRLPHVQGRSGARGLSPGLPDPRQGGASGLAGRVLRRGHGGVPS